ncbi:major facilitator superfamily transporter [Sarocladium implicatum]|nr:major facilitator superfamily transporter [Sarocladium implicatum]
MAATTASPLSSVSSPASFYTANASIGGISTSASSPVQGRPSPYRRTRQLPLELKQHCQILLEEQLYVPAINLLNSALCAGTSNHRANSRPVAVPPPSHIALLSTLAIHPSYTTRAEKPELCTIANLSLAYLQSLLETAGPLNADFSKAFQVNTLSRYTRAGGYGGTESNSDVSDAESDRDDDRLRGKMSHDSSVWNRSRDFWALVGWAFRCSTLHPHRWQYWKRWLSFVLDVLEKDWEERLRIDLESHELSGDSGEAPAVSRQDSMIAKYMGNLSGESGCRTLVRSLLVSGDRSAATYPEIFDREPRGPKKSSNKRKRDAVLDLENDRFGDYFDEESVSSGVSEPPTPQKPKDGRPQATANPSTGLLESTDLRLRLFKILATALHALREKDLGDLYWIFASEVKTLSLPMFSLLITTRVNPLPEISQHALVKDLLRQLLNKRPRVMDENNVLDVAMAKKHFICQAANTSATEDNAKLSLVVENTLQLLWRGMLETSGDIDRLTEAAEKGIAAREARLKKKRSASHAGQREEALAQQVLTRSGNRIGILVEAMVKLSE